MKDRYKDIKGYRFDRWLFQFGMWFCLFWLLLVAWSYDFSLDFYSCELDPDHAVTGEIYGGLCRNPFYTEPTWKNSQYLPPGDYGFKPGLLFYSIFYVPLLVFALIGVLNDYYHNRRGEK